MRVGEGAASGITPLRIQGHRWCQGHLGPSGAQDQELPVPVGRPPAGHPELRLDQHHRAGQLPLADPGARRVVEHEPVHRVVLPSALLLALDVQRRGQRMPHGEIEPPAGPAPARTRSLQRDHCHHGPMAGLSRRRHGAVGQGRNRPGTGMNSGSLISGGCQLIRSVNCTSGLSGRETNTQRLSRSTRHTSRTPRVR